MYSSLYAWLNMLPGLFRGLCSLVTCNCTVGVGALQVCFSWLLQLLPAMFDNICSQTSAVLKRTRTNCADKDLGFDQSGVWFPACQVWRL